MSTLIADAVGAVVSALAAAPAVADQVLRARLRPMAAQHTSMVVVRPVESSVEEDELAGPVVSWSTLIAVECDARTNAATSPDVAVDAVLQAVHSRLAANPTLSGVVLSIVPRKVTFDTDADGEASVCAVSLFTARQRAPAGAL